MAYNKVPDEEKQRRKEERYKIKWNKEHKVINDVIYKLCNLHPTHFPNEDEFVLMNDENFYKNDKNSIDGYSTRCKKCEIKQSGKWIKDNYSRHKKSHKKYRATDSYKEWNRKNHIKMQDKIKEWMIKNKDKVNQYSKNHGQKEHRISAKEWDACKFYFCHRCAYCGMPIEEHFVKRKGKYEWHDLHKEHVIHDGRIDLKNCIPACNSCNSSKKKQSLNSWYNSRNPNYTYERYHKIYQWLRYDYKKYIVKRKPKQKYERKIK